MRAALTAAIVVTCLSSAFAAWPLFSANTEQDEFLVVLTCYAGFESRIAAGRASRQVRSADLWQNLPERDKLISCTLKGCERLWWLVIYNVAEPTGPEDGGGHQRAEARNSRLAEKRE